MEIFRINLSDIGKTFIVRPIPNGKDLSKNILSYRNYLKFDGNWGYRHVCFANIDGEFKIFDFPEAIANIIKKDISMIFLNSDRAVQVEVISKHIDGSEFLNYKLSIVSDEKYKYDSTEEKRNFILDFFKKTNLDLSIALEERRIESILWMEKSMKRFSTKDNISHKIFYEIYESEVSSNRKELRDYKIKKILDGHI